MIASVSGRGIGSFQCAIYLATAEPTRPTRRESAKSAARETGSLAPPAHGLNVPTRLTRDLGHGEGYVYDHDTEDGFAGLDYFPDGMARSVLPAVGAASRWNCKNAWISGRLSDGKNETVPMPDVVTFNGFHRGGEL